MSLAVIEAVSSTKDCPPESLPPLTSAVDPDALDDIFASTHDGNNRRHGQITFTYYNTTITINHAEHISVDPHTEGSPA